MCRETTTTRLADSRTRRRGLAPTWQLEPLEDRLLLSIALDGRPRWGDVLVRRERPWLIAGQVEVPAAAVSGATTGGARTLVDQPAPLWQPPPYARSAIEIGSVTARVFTAGPGTEPSAVEGPAPLTKLVLPPLPPLIAVGTRAAEPARFADTPDGPVLASVGGASGRAAIAFPGGVLWQKLGASPPWPAYALEEVGFASGQGDPGGPPGKSFPPPMLLERYLMRHGDLTTTSGIDLLGSNDGNEVFTVEGSTAPSVFLGIFPGEGGTLLGKPLGLALMAYEEGDGRIGLSEWGMPGGSLTFSLRGLLGAEFARFATRTLRVSASPDADWENGLIAQSDNLLPLFTSEWFGGPHEGSSILAQLSFLEGEGVAQPLPGAGLAGVNPLDFGPGPSGADPAVLVEDEGAAAGPWKAVISARGILDPEGLFLVDDLPELNALAAALLGDLMGETAALSLPVLGRVQEVAELGPLDESSLALAATVLTVSAEVSAEPSAHGAGPAAAPRQAAAEAEADAGAGAGAESPSWAGFVMGLDEAFEASRLAARRWALPRGSELASDPPEPSGEAADEADRAAVDEALRQLDDQDGPTSLDEELYLLLPEVDDLAPLDDEQRPAAAAGAGSVALSAAPALLAGTIAPPARRRRERLRTARLDPDEERDPDD